MSQTTQPVNYIRHLSGVLQKMSDDDRCTASHISLYMMIFQQWNARRFASRFQIYRDELMQECKIRNPNSYTRCLRNLHEWGYLEYYPSRSKHAPSQVSMIVHTKAGPDAEVPKDRQTGTFDKDTDKDRDKSSDNDEPADLPSFDTDTDKRTDTGSDNGSGTIIINNTKPNKTHLNALNSFLNGSPGGEKEDFQSIGKNAVIQSQSPDVAPEERKKVAPKKKEPAGTRPEPPDLPFCESPCADKDFFKRAFAGTEYETANLDYYHEVIGNWSLSKDARKKDWIAAAKNWMLNDYRAGKLVTQTTLNSPAVYGKATAATTRSRTGVDLDALFALIDHAHSPK